MKVTKNTKENTLFILGSDLGIITKIRENSFDYFLPLFDSEYKKIKFDDEQLTEAIEFSLEDYTKVSEKQKTILFENVLPLIEKIIVLKNQYKASLKTIEGMWSDLD
jgi:hypothetical protein